MHFTAFGVNGSGAFEDIPINVMRKVTTLRRVHASREHVLAPLGLCVVGLATTCYPTHWVTVQVNETIKLMTIVPRHAAPTLS